MKTILTLVLFLTSVQAIGQTVIATDVKATRKLTVPATTAAVTSSTGSLKIDTDGPDANITQSVLTYWDGTRIMYVLGVDAIPSTDNFALTYDSVAKKFVFEAQAGGGGSVSISGTPVAGQAAEWTSATAIQGVATTGTGSYVKGTAPTITLANGTGLPISTGVAGLGTGVATFLATPSSANFATAVTGETGTGGVVLDTAPVFPTTITVGAAGGATGDILLKGTTSGTVTLSVADAAGTYSMYLPTSVGTADQLMVTDGSSQLNWVSSMGTGWFAREFTSTVSDWTIQASQLNDPILSGAQSGEIEFLGGGGSVFLRPGTSGVTTHTNTLPLAHGTANQLMRTDALGQWSWVSPYNTGVAETTVASATTTDLGAVASDKVSITGTTTITGFGTVAAGTKREGRFTGVLTLTHNATSLIVPGNANIVTAAGDRFQAYSLGSGNWVVSSYTKADGTAVVGGGGGVSDGDKTDITVTGGGLTWTIDPDVVTNAKLANMAASTIKARVTGSTGDPEDATLSQVLDLVGSAANGDMLVRSGGSWGRLVAPTGVFPSTLYNGPDGFEWVNARTHYIFTEDWLYHGLVGYAGWGSGGSSANVSSEAQGNGLMGVSTSTSATGTRALTPNSANMIFGEGQVVGQFRGKIPALSTPSERFTVHVGFIDGEVGGTDGAYFRYTDSVSSGNWEACTESNNSITATDTGVAATTSYTDWQIVVNAAGNEVKFYIDGTLVRTETATIPTGAARATSFGFGIQKSIGTTQRDFYSDYIQVYKKFTTAR